MTLLTDRYDPPSKRELIDAKSSMSLSASGFRKVFGRHDEDTGGTISNADAILAGYMAMTFARALRDRYGDRKITAAVATDSRPTGPSLASAIIRVLVSQRIDVRYSEITAIPELLAAVKQESELDGFAYISASHNPVGHNGFKFGYSDGSVAGGSDATALIESFHELCESEEPRNIACAMHDAPKDKLQRIYDQIDASKTLFYECYRSFIKSTAAGGEGPGGDAHFLELRRSAATRPLGVVAELNGSARTVSIDSQILGEAGLSVRVINGNPGEITHRIVPEGSSLDLCKDELQKAHKIDGKFILGYVPDNDGDRGNIVYIDPKDGAGHVLQAQEVFAVACVSELSYLAYTHWDEEGHLELNQATVVVNGPTSMRIDRIAEAFGATVARAEVGEANVVNLARVLRKEGRVVRILGEGSNGGNITHPSTCRDPMNTIFAVVKLLLLRGDSRKPGLYEIWCRVTHQPYEPDFTFQDIVASLPRFTTTSAYEDRAIMKISSEHHGELKSRYEALFQETWTTIKSGLSKTHDVSGWQIVNYEGTEERRGMGNRDPTGKENGGLKVVFSSENGADCPGR